MRLNYFKTVFTTICVPATFSLASLGANAEANPASSSIAEHTARLPGIETGVFDSDNRMKRPMDVEGWVFLGSSLGLTYVDAVDDPETPGFFSAVFIEPGAYRAFLETGDFIDGTVFAKIVYSTTKEGGGVAMNETVYFEAHVRDSIRFPETQSSFYGWSPSDQGYADAFPVSMGCLSCHEENASYQNVFTQFYPTIRDSPETKIAEEERARLGILETQTPQTPGDKL